MKLSDLSKLTKEEILAHLSKPSQNTPIDPEPETEPAPEDTSLDDPDKASLIGFSVEQVDVIRCIDALTTAQELYIPKGCLLQIRLAQAQYLLQIYAGISLSPEEEDEEDEVEKESGDETQPSKSEPYTVG